MAHEKVKPTDWLTETPMDHSMELQMELQMDQLMERQMEKLMDLLMAGPMAHYLDCRKRRWSASSWDLAMAQRYA